MPVQNPSGDHDPRPLLLINPSREQAALVRGEDGQWRSNTMPYYRDLGLSTPGHDFVLDRPITDATADFNGQTVTVDLEDHPGGAWSCAAAGDVGSRIRHLGGITLGTTTAINPDEVRTHQQMGELIRAERIAMGWVALQGTEHQTPLREVPAPDSLTTYLLHWSSDHLTVGELVDTTDRALTPEQAQAWASSRVQGPDVALIGWDQIVGDPNAWFTMDAISVTQYVVRRHADAWKLVQILSRIDGPTPPTEDEARRCAESAVRTKARNRIVSWVPGPTTSEGFTTLHGSAIQRS